MACKKCHRSAGKNLFTTCSHHIMCFKVPNINRKSLVGFFYSLHHTKMWKLQSVIRSDVHSFTEMLSIVNCIKSTTFKISFGLSSLQGNHLTMILFSYISLLAVLREKLLQHLTELKDEFRYFHPNADNHLTEVFFKKRKILTIHTYLAVIFYNLNRSVFFKVPIQTYWSLRISFLH